MRRALFACCLIAACGPRPEPLVDAGGHDAAVADSGAVDSGRPDAGGSDAGPPAGCRTPDGGTPVFGLNDVSILVPPSIDLVPVAQLIPRAIYDRVIRNPAAGGGIDQDFIFNAYDEFRVVAVRFDLCDRIASGPCPVNDPRFRLVLQRVQMSQARDTALHAFFTVPAAELQPILGELEALARLQATSTAAVLQPSPALRASPNGMYAQKLGALLRRYCTTTTLSRLTFFAQPDLFAQIRWVFRGVELDGGAFADIPIPHATDGGIQHVLLGRNGYDVTMLADAPAGFARATSERAIAMSSPAQITEALSALAEINDPLSRGVDTLQCVACHVATPLVQPRADAGTVPARFTSSYDLSLDGGDSPASLGSLRAFGWFGDRPMISQRVVNETAQLLAELQQCR